LIQGTESHPIETIVLQGFACEEKIFNAQATLQLVKKSADIGFLTSYLLFKLVS
jgi:hypothetical protein